MPVLAAARNTQGHRVEVSINIVLKKIHTCYILKHNTNAYNVRAHTHTAPTLPHYTLHHTTPHHTTLHYTTTKWDKDSRAFASPVYTMYPLMYQLGGLLPQLTSGHQVPIEQLGRLEQYEYSFLLNLGPFDYQADALTTWLCCLHRYTHHTPTTHIHCTQTHTRARARTHVRTHTRTHTHTDTHKNTHRHT